jgi:hypothetical protein
LDVWFLNPSSTEGHTFIFIYKDITLSGVQKKSSYLVQNIYILFFIIILGVLTSYSAGRTEQKRRPGCSEWRQPVQGKVRLKD